MKKGRIRTCLLILLSLIFSPLPLQAETEVRNLSNRRYLEEALRAIQKAERSIFVVMYHAPLDPSNLHSPVTRIARALIEAKDRGVSVRVVLDQEIQTDRARGGAPMKNLRAYHFFKENGVSVAFDSLGRRTHAKLLVIDEEVAILGSTNWSREAMEQNYEANLLVHSPETARELLEEFKTIELLGPEKTTAPQEFLRLSRNFLLDKNQGPRLHEGDARRAFQLYLILISQELKGPSHEFNYDETAGLLGLGKISREGYRRQLIKVLKKLADDYRLIRFEPRHGKEAVVTLLDPARPGEAYQSPAENYFEFPRGLFLGSWLQSLSLRAVYSLLILYDQGSYPRTGPAIQVGLETLEKRYSVSQKTLGEGFRELARADLIEIYYGRTIDFEKREFETASYVLLPFHDPAERERKLGQLEALYGKAAFQKSQDHARAFFKEKDPEVIQTLMGLRWTYSPEWVDRAMKEVILKKDVGNPARSLPYLIGVLKQWKETGGPVFNLSSDSK